MREDGTSIEVRHLYEGISRGFSEDVQAFEAELKRMVATHYAFIIDRGFSVTINRKPVKPRPTRLIFAKGPRAGKAPAIQPFMFKATADGVQVFLAVGFTRPIPSEDEALSEQEETRYSALDAGWTVLCNDRAVVYSDRSVLTGWGEAGVPRYHNQFIAISGMVEFRSDDPSKLPTTTTKRGIDASSLLYLQIKNKMREGMLIFIDYTNKWKRQAEQSKRHVEKGKALSLDQIRQEAEGLRFSSTARTVPKGEQYRPKLPMPPGVGPHKRRISFAKDVGEVKSVAKHLFDDEDKEPSAVGEKCFDLILEEARR